MDEALALPTEKSARIALRTQQVIAHETNVAHVADPLGGSHFVEELTDEMERQAEEIFAKLDDFGQGSMLEGCITGIDENWFQSRIGDSAYELERKFNAGERIVVGVSDFREGNDDDEMDTLQISNKDEARQRARLDTVKNDRSQEAVDKILAQLAAEAADPEVNLMPTLIEASHTYATLGEVMGTMANVSSAGTRKSPPSSAGRRLGGPPGAPRAGAQRRPARTLARRVPGGPI